MGKPIDPHTKATVLAKIRDEGISAVDASSKYGVTTKTIYRWLRESVEDSTSNRNFILENNRLKKELEIAYRILGKLTADTQRSKD